MNNSAPHGISYIETYARGGKMVDLYSDRVIREAVYIIENNATLRACAAAFGVGKSTVHTDVSKKLKYVDRALYDDVKNVLDVNLAERHLRGGKSTKKLYEQKKTHV